MKKNGAGYLFSPSDLIKYMQCAYVSFLDRCYVDFPNEFQPDAEDEFVTLIQACGDEHEKEYVKQLAQKSDIRDLSAEGDVQQATLRAMQDGVPVIYQGAIAYDGFAGYSDFLVRVPGPSQLGSFHYEVWDTKLAREPKPYYLIQLCCYAEMLEYIQGVRPAEVAVILGNKQERRFRTDDYFFYYRELKKTFVAFQEGFSREVPPFITGNEDFGRWEKRVRAELTEQDHLSQVANITSGQIVKLQAAEVKTRAALAARTEPVRKMAEATVARLRTQAQLQIQSEGKEKPAYLVVPPDEVNQRRGLQLLPPAESGDVFFDIEGYPLYEQGLEYLLGVVYHEGDGFKYRDWWAHDRKQEQLSFESFVSWAHARWQANPSLHIYHYASYETAALQRLIRVHHYGCGDKLDDLLRNEVFVDLYRIVRQSMLVGEPRYSIKNIEHLYREKRSGEVTTAGGSVVEYRRWLDSKQGPTPGSSAILASIRDYNAEDCESTAQLADWLRELQVEHNIGYLPPPNLPDGEIQSHEPTEAEILATELLSEISDIEPLSPEDQLKQLLAYLLQFHKREEKPIWWAVFDWAKSTEAELIEDLNCLGGLQRTNTPRGEVKRSWRYEYSFNPDQDTKLEAGDECRFAHSVFKIIKIETLDRENGLLTLKLGKAQEAPPDRISLLPQELVKAGAIEESILETVKNWRAGGQLPSALSDLLLRHSPNIGGVADDPIVKPGTDLVAGTVSAVCNMKQTTLCIQGPPGTGKTYTAARAIMALLQQGKRIGISANSHKAVLNLEREVAEIAAQNGFSLRGIHVRRGEDLDVLPARFQYIAQAKEVDWSMLPQVIGGTAWAFSAPEFSGKFDYLFIDEAGQVSLANIVGMCRSTRNLVLIGDQMQLSQPTRAAHPANSGVSALDYLLDGRATISPDFGIFLNTSRRMHSAVCRFISSACYEDRLTSHPETDSRYLLLNSCKYVTKQAGVQFIPVPHTGNTQCSEEEVEAIARIITELTSSSVLYQDGPKQRRLSVSDILVIAPYNMQVRRIAARLPGLRVASVDKFQGQEAPVVIYSMAASSAEECPRGMDFLFNRNRTNVAISRAKALAIVVASPELARVHCSGVEQMSLANLFCRVIQEGSRCSAPPAAAASS